MQRKLILIRHAITTAPPHTFLGRTNDFPLSHDGISDVQKLSTTLEISRPGIKVFSSSLKRARETGQILFPSLQIQEDKRLDEVDFGKWGGMTVSEISTESPGLFRKWEMDPMNFTFPEGESVPGFIERIKSFLTDYPLKNSEDHVLVCHGGVIRFIICALLNLPFSHHLAFEVKRPSVNVIDHDGRYGVLSGLNLSEYKLK